MNNSREQVVVLGNGPAGMTAVNNLRTFDPLLLAPEQTPSPSTCGGVLTAPATNHLKQTGLFEPMVKRAGQILRTLSVSTGGDVLLRHSLPKEEMVSFNRDRFDQTLWDVLDLQNVRFQSAHVSAFHSRVDHIEINTTSGKTIRTAGVIDGTGHRQITGDTSSSPARKLVGLEWHVDTVLPELDTLHLVLGDRWYAGITTTPENKTTVSAVVSHDRYIHDRPDGIWDDLIKKSPPTVREVLPERTTDSPKTKSGFWHTRSGKAITPRIVRVGDALGFTMPLSGEGIAMAMREGNIAGKFLSLKENSPFPLSRSNQKQLFEQLVLPFRKQIPRWKRTHWLGMHGPWTHRLYNVLPASVRWLFRFHKPSPNHW